MWKLCGEAEPSESAFRSAAESAADQSTAYRAYNEVIHSLISRGITAAAEASCRQAIDKVPEFAHLLSISLTGILRVAGRLEEALQVIDGVTERYPDMGDAHANRAVVLYGLGRHSEAEHAVARTSELAPDLVAHLRQLGHLPEARDK